MNEIALASLLGIVEGLTEYLPISSTGHLIVFGSIFGFTGPKAETFEIFIQVGAILAVIALYTDRFLALIPRQVTGQSIKNAVSTAELSGKGFVGWTGLIKLFVGCLPAFVVGFALHKVIKLYLFSPTVVAVSLIGGGIILLFVPDQPKGEPIDQLDDMTMIDCFKVGMFQLLALCPGVSRSAATIVGGMLCGLRKDVAAQFSFFLAVPTIAAAAGYDLLKSFSSLSQADLPMFFVGTVVSFMTAVLAIRVFIAMLQRYSLRPWGVYRIVFGFVILGLNL